MVRETRPKPVRPPRPSQRPQTQINPQTRRLNHRPKPDSESSFEGLSDLDDLDDNALDRRSAPIQTQYSTKPAIVYKKYISPRMSPKEPKKLKIEFPSRKIAKKDSNLTQKNFNFFHDFESYEKPSDEGIRASNVYVKARVDVGFNRFGYLSSQLNRTQSSLQGLQGGCHEHTGSLPSPRGPLLPLGRGKKGLGAKKYKLSRSSVHTLLNTKINFTTPQKFRSERFYAWMQSSILKSIQKFVETSFRLSKVISLKKMTITKIEEFFGEILTSVYLVLAKLAAYKRMVDGKVNFTLQSEIGRQLIIMVGRYQFVVQAAQLNIPGSRSYIYLDAFLYFFSVLVKDLGEMPSLNRGVGAKFCKIVMMLVKNYKHRIKIGLMDSRRKARMNCKSTNLNIV